MYEDFLYVSFLHTYIPLIINTPPPLQCGAFVTTDEPTWTDHYPLTPWLTLQLTLVFVPVSQTNV